MDEETLSNVSAAVVAPRAGSARRLPTAFSAATWKRTAYALLALPLALVGLVLAVVGLGPVVARWHRWLVGRLLGVVVPQPPTTRVRRVLGHALVGLPLHAVGLVVAGYGWLIVVMNLGYPLHGIGPGGYHLDTTDGAWGGPSFAGAWAVHAWGGLAFLVLVPVLLYAVTWLQGRLAVALLGAR